jgi:hypothetical protein
MWTKSSGDERGGGNSYCGGENSSNECAGYNFDGRESV